jgi:hypothetical protein
MPAPPPLKGHIHPHSPAISALITNLTSSNFLTAESSCDLDWRDQQRAHFDHSQRGHVKSCPQSRLRLNVFANHRPQHRARKAGAACRGPIPAILAATAPPNCHPASRGPCPGPCEELGLPREPISDVPAIGPASRSGVAQPPPRMTCAPSSTSRRFLGRSLLLDWIEIIEWSVRPQGQPRHTVDDDKKGGCRLVPRLLIDPLPLRLTSCECEGEMWGPRCLMHRA